MFIWLLYHALSTCARARIAKKEAVWPPFLFGAYRVLRLLNRNIKEGAKAPSFIFGTSIHNVLGIKTPARIRIFNPYRRDIFVSI